jgi:hypothetical protein
MSTNPALAELEPLVGHWRMEVDGVAFLPDPGTRVTGSINVDWIEGGAAIVIRQGDSEHPPAAVWIIGRDDTEDEYSVLYADGRGVSRTYRMSFGDAHWQMWRDTPEFSERFYAELDPAGQRISGRWEKSADEGANWEHDFNIDYIRAERPNPNP